MHPSYSRYERDELNQVNLSVCSTQTEVVVSSLLQSPAADKVEEEVDVEFQ